MTQTDKSFIPHWRQSAAFWQFSSRYHFTFPEIRLTYWCCSSTTSFRSL